MKMQSINIGSKVTNKKWKKSGTRTITDIRVHNGQILLMLEDDGTKETGSTVSNSGLTVVSEPIKRYVMFGGKHYETELGTKGVIGKFTTPEEAEEYEIESLRNNEEWMSCWTYELVDIFTMESLYYRDVGLDGKLHELSNGKWILVES